MKVKYYPATEKCTTCGGACCKGYAGIVLPEQIPGDSIQEQAAELVKMLRSKKYCLDYWEASPCIYFVRPSHKEWKGELIDASWGGECVFLGSRGCRLKPDKRPAQCQMLEPTEDKCVGHFGGKLPGAKAWRQHGLYPLLLDIVRGLDFDEISERYCK
ncbi:MAG: hypothetical protein WC356_04345 [Candidatus Micrarchaeia archaeon]|jgi:Fe-S-cluster containining protein